MYSDSNLEYNLNTILLTIKILRPIRLPIFFFTLNQSIQCYIIIFVSPTRCQAAQHLTHSRALARKRFDRESNGARQVNGRRPLIQLELF